MFTIIATIFSDIVRNKWHRRGGGTRSYGWVKDKLQEAGAVPRAKGRGRRRKRRERAPWPGMLLHQDGSTREWVEGRQWDLIVTMDDATSERCSMFLCEQEGTWSSFRGVREAAAVHPALVPQWPMPLKQAISAGGMHFADFQAKLTSLPLIVMIIGNVNAN